MKPFHIYDKMYNQNYFVCYGWTHNQYHNYFKKAYGVQLDATGLVGQCTTIENESLGRSIIVIFVSKKSNAEMTITLAHECVHAGNKCLRSRGVITDQINDEPLAYLVSYLMREILN